MKIFLAFTLLLVIASIFLSFQQNKGDKMGGSISPAKSFWLFYCIYTWFLLLPFILYKELVPEPLYTLWLGFVGWMIFRGAAEMFMMFITKNWTPPLGIAHNISCIAWLVLGSIYYRTTLSTLELPFIIFHISLIIGLFMETYYAIVFYKIVGSKTKGDKAVWYANKEDPIFKRVVKITALFNFPLYGCLIFFTESLVYF